MAPVIPPPQNSRSGEDEPGESLPVEAALGNAPAKRGEFFRVPAVLEE